MRLMLDAARRAAMDGVKGSASKSSAEREEIAGLQAARDARDKMKIERGSEGAEAAEREREARLAKMAAEAQAKTAVVDTKSALAALAKRKPKKPTKGADSGMLAYNQETRASVLSENPGMSTPQVGAELRQRWAGMSMTDQSEWDTKANANKENHAKALEDFKAKEAAWAAEKQAILSGAPAAALKKPADATVTAVSPQVF